MSCAHELISICGIYVMFEKHDFFGMYMAITYFLPHDTEGTINVKIAFVMLR